MFKLALGYCIAICAIPNLFWEGCSHHDHTHPLRSPLVVIAWSGLWEIQVRLRGGRSTPPQAQSDAQEEWIERFGEKYRKMQHCGAGQKASQIVGILLFHPSLLSDLPHGLSVGILCSSSTLTFVPSPTCSALMRSYRLLLLHHVASGFWTDPYSSEHLLPTDPFLTDSQPLQYYCQL